MKGIIHPPNCYVTTGEEDGRCTCGLMVQLPIAFLKELVSELRDMGWAEDEDSYIYDILSAIQKEEDTIK